MRATEEPSPGELDRLLDEVYEKLLELFPEAATRQGDHRYDHLLSDPGPEGQERYREALRSFLDRLEGIDAAGLPPRKGLTRELCRRWLETELEGFGLLGHLIRLDPLQGFQITLPQLIAEMPLETAEDFERCLERLARVKGYIAGALETAREGLLRGRVQAVPAVEKVIAQIDLQLALAPTDHPFYRPFKSIAGKIARPVRSKILDRARRIIHEEAIPALRSFREILREEYLPRARREAGVWSLPGGEELYGWLARRSTTTALTPEEIHRMGQGEVERIRKEMEELERGLGKSGSLNELFESLRVDPRFYHQNAEDLLAGYREIARRADRELPRFFGKLPRMKYEVVPVPDYAAASNTTAYYRPPPADGSRPGLFYANTHDLSSRPRYEMEALALHEAVPGHHLQIALQLELPDLPRLRARWLSFTAFVEGWGLYAERLGREMGFYRDPYSELGRLIYEMWRACRLVVDTGIHRFRWTRKEAADFMLENTALSRLNIESEVDRYIAWPGQALAYKIGELKIRELRARAERELGSSFDLRAFHDRLLEEGSLPLDLLEGRVDDWIRSRIKSSPSKVEHGGHRDE